MGPSKVLWNRKYVLLMHVYTCSIRLLPRNNWPVYFIDFYRFKPFIKNVCSTWTSSIIRINKLLYYHMQELCKTNAPKILSKSFWTVTELFSIKQCLVWPSILIATHSEIYLAGFVHIPVNLWFSKRVIWVIHVFFA